MFSRLDFVDPYFEVKNFSVYIEIKAEDRFGNPNYRHYSVYNAAVDRFSEH